MSTASDIQDRDEGVFEVGDTIVHPSQGAGKITRVDRLDIAGMVKHYYHIQLISGDGELMLPVDGVEGLGIRPVSEEIDTLRDTLFNTPQGLSADFKIRKAAITARIQSGRLLEAMSALRDLAWQEQVKQLSVTEMKLKERAEKLIASEWSAYLGISFDAAIQRLNTLVNEAMQWHLQNTAATP